MYYKNIFLFYLIFCTHLSHISATVGEITIGIPPAEVPNFPRTIEYIRGLQRENHRLVVEGNRFRQECENGLDELKERVKLIDQKAGVFKIDASTANKENRHLRNAIILKAAVSFARENCEEGKTAALLIDSFKIDEAATVNVLTRVINQTRGKYYWQQGESDFTEDGLGFLTSAMAVSIIDLVGETSVGKSIEEVFKGQLKPLKKPCKYIAEVCLTEVIRSSIEGLLFPAAKKVRR